MLKLLWFMVWFFHFLDTALYCLPDYCWNTVLWWCRCPNSLRKDSAAASPGQQCGCPLNKAAFKGQTSCSWELQQVWTWSHSGERLMPPMFLIHIGGVKGYCSTERTKKSISHKSYCKDEICSFSPWRWISNAQVFCGWFLEVSASLLSQCSNNAVRHFSIPRKVSLLWVLYLGFFQVESLSSFSVNQIFW